MGLGFDIRVCGSYEMWEEEQLREEEDGVYTWCNDFSFLLVGVDVW